MLVEAFSPGFFERRWQEIQDPNSVGGATTGGRSG